MSEKTEALRLAAELEACPSINYKSHAAELRRLHAENKRLSWDSIHTCHAECQRPVCRLTRERDALLEALKEVTPSMPPVDAPCHYGIVPQEKCGHCGRIAKARAAIKAVEGENYAKDL